MLLQSRACTAQHRLKKILSVSHRLQFPKFTSSVTVHASSMGDAVMDGSADAWNAAARGYEQLGAARSSTGLKVAGLKAGDSLLDVGTGPGVNFEVHKRLLQHIVFNAEMNNAHDHDTEQSAVVATTIVQHISTGMLLPVLVYYN